MNDGQQLAQPLELWGGVECTHNRVGDHYFDQMDRSGHSTRLDDLDRFADLGIRALRYPLLWERTAPDGPDRADWTWGDARMSRLQALGVEPIIGLVHHGSGPAHTNLLDPEFPEHLALYARAVAERYPWVRRYTPINEPLTTARFSGLYGHWYPHGRDNLAFVRALLVQCRAVILAMRAIRQVNAGAQLVQTEDLGKTHSTPALQYQADLENERRWLSYDLLCGRVDRHHSLWSWLLSLGIKEAEFTWFLDNPCPPDLFGINYYITSERFLDERLHGYPTHMHGGNGKHRYADVEAVRAMADGPAGLAALLEEAAARYDGSLAITEAHIDCTEDEQARWLLEVWDAAQQVRQAGRDVQAVTIWSLLGAYDWNGLVTCDRGYYEPGAFDVRSGQPRPTLLAEVARGLARGETHIHSWLGTPGWWRRPERILYPPVQAKAG